MPRVRFLQHRGVVAYIGGGTLLLDDSMIFGTDNTTVRTLGSF